MRPLRYVLDSTRLFLVMVLWLVLWSAGQLWPTAYWFEVRSVSAGPALAGRAVPMTVDRTIRQPFFGTWHVVVRRWSEAGGGWLTHCTADGINDYKPTSKLPTDLTLAWWTDDGCKALSVGRYTVATTWLVDPGVPLVPSKRVTVESNIFEVTP